MDNVIKTNICGKSINIKKTVPFLIIVHVPAGYHIATNYQIATAIST